MDTQLKKGSIELSLLAILSHKDGYGYELGKMLSEMIDIKEGTVYLILQRLEKTGDLDSYMDSKEGNKKRKYYTLNDQGQTKLNALIKEWNLINEFVDTCIKGVDRHE